LPPPQQGSFVPKNQYFSGGFSFPQLLPFLASDSDGRLFGRWVPATQRGTDHGVQRDWDSNGAFRHSRDCYIVVSGDAGTNAFTRSITWSPAFLQTNDLVLKVQAALAHWLHVRSTAEDCPLLTYLGSAYHLGGLCYCCWRTLSGSVSLAVQTERKLNVTTSFVTRSFHSCCPLCCFGVSGSLKRTAYTREGCSQLQCCLEGTTSRR
jgi:hypothetical protein